MDEGAAGPRCLGAGARKAAGRAARRRLPRRLHRGWEPPSDRPDPIEILQAQAATREQDLVPIRYGRMLSSPFAFFRGGPAIMANDLAGTPSSGITVQACGDAHLVNFGLFGSPERDLVFSLNDFDETLPPGSAVRSHMALMGKGFSLVKDSGDGPGGAAGLEV
jgi:hypothetical protein